MDPQEERIANELSRNCKVITTCFVGREVREDTEFAGDPPGPYIHCQNFATPERVLELVAYIYELERKIDPGVECDTVLVNNDVGWKRGNAYLESIRDTKVFAGRLRVIHRENFGRSFGGYNKAYEVFGHRYRYWTFTEDDILVLGHHYFRRCIETFEAQPDTGFVAIQGLSREIILHAHGGVGTTRIDVLDRVHRQFGKLPHCEQHEPQAYDDIVTRGEVAFTNAIRQIGYGLVEVKADQPLYVYAYDHMRGRDHWDLLAQNGAWSVRHARRRAFQVYAQARALGSRLKRLGRRSIRRV